MKDSDKDGGAAKAGERAVGSMVTSAAAAAASQQNREVVFSGKKRHGMERMNATEKRKSKQAATSMCTRRGDGRCCGRKERCNRRPGSCSGVTRAGRGGSGPVISRAAARAAHTHRSAVTVQKENP